jgi:hypothetical protein
MVLAASPLPSSPATRVRAWFAEDRLIVTRRVMFRPGEFQTTPDSRPVLDAIASALKSVSTDKMVLIEGHSDAGGDEAENVRLSQARADFVVAAFVARGVDASRLQAIGMGSSKPLVGPESAEQYRNRRIEVLLRALSQPEPDATTVASAVEPSSVGLSAASGPHLSLLSDDVAPDQPTSSASSHPFQVPLLDDAPILLAWAKPRVPLLDENADDDGLMALDIRSTTRSRPRIPLLDVGDAPRGIGLVD